jgi:hypothetical protein
VLSIHRPRLEDGRRVSDNGARQGESYPAPPKVSILVLDEKWPPTYVQVYCDARIDATMESDAERVIDSMMRLYDLMAGKPMPESAHPNAAETARREKRVILRLKPYATWDPRTGREAVQSRFSRMPSNSFEPQSRSR